MARHPHTGLATVSWLCEGPLTHRNSRGNHALVNPAEVDLMIAGRGITHSEYSTRDTEILHGVQLWFALRDADRFMSPDFFTHPAPMRMLGGIAVRVGIGNLTFDFEADGGGDSSAQEASTVYTPTRLTLAQLDMPAGSWIEIGLHEADEYALLVDHGAVTAEGNVEGREVRGEASQHAPLAFPGPMTKVRLTAGAESVRVLLLGGEPLGENIVMWWNFVGRSHSEIKAFRDRYQFEIHVEDALVDAPVHAHAAQTLAAEGATLQCGPFAAQTPEPLPAPNLPHVRMMPRGRVGAAK